MLAQPRLGSGSAVAAARRVAASAATLLRSRFGFFLLLAAVFELYIAHQIRAIAGGPGAPLDDVFIHLQYARSIAEGHPFRYSSPTDLPSSGATSVLYAALLAVPQVLGVHGEAVLGAAHALCAVGWAAAAEGMYRVGERAWGPVLAWASAAMAFLCAGFVWAAGSCMETILAVALVAWCFALALELDETRERRAAVALAVVGALGPWVRSELAAVAALAAGAVLLRARGRTRLAALAPVLSVPAQLLFWKVVTGTSRTSGALAKWVFYDPYFTRAEILEHCRAALAGMTTEVLAGHGWAVRYFPDGVNRLAAAGFLVVLARALYRRRWVSALVWLGALALLAVPATFIPWDMHRYRYLWPVFALPLVCALAAPVALGEGLARAVARLRGTRGADAAAGALSAGLAGALLALFAWRVPDAVQDLGDCSRAIRGQQVTLAQRDVARLPAGARVLMNDAGAIAYFGGHATVDDVGLTTMSFAEAYTNGAGSVVEALEALPAARRPTYGALYRGWIDNPPVLGHTIAQATVSQHSILGGNTAELMPLRTELLGTGEQPFALLPGERVADAVDVAWVESERAHGYDNEGDHRGDDLVREYDVLGRGPVLEGGRIVARRETLTLRGAPGRPGRVLLRTDAWYPVTLRFVWNGVLLDAAHAVPGAHSFIDTAVEVPATLARGENRLEVSLASGTNYGSFHYFYVQR